MTKTIINRDTAIEAIWSEPILRTGNWFKDLEDIKLCSVCAVGSVLREHCFTTIDLVGLRRNKVIAKACKNKFNQFPSYLLIESDDTNYLGNLSSVFERAYIDYNTPPDSVEMRDLLTSEICAMWPEQFEIDWNNGSKITVLKQ